MLRSDWKWYAVLTDDGADKLREASASHVVQIEQYFTSRYDQSELGALSALLGRVETGEPLDCGAAPSRSESKFCQ